MLHETQLIATIVWGLGLAFVLGTLANRLRFPPLVGYLLAGVLVGPYTPGFVADQTLVPELAEIGVILLMFGVGLHFSLQDLLSVRAIAVPGAIVQIAVATLLGFGMSHLMGWPAGGGLIFGLALSVASTVVLLRALQERRLVETERGRIAVGWLIVEDLAMVLALVLLPALAGVLGSPKAVTADASAGWLGLGIWGALLLTLVKVGAFVALMLVVGRRLVPKLLHHIAHTGSRELFRLAVLVIALGVAFGAAKLFGVSLALGAFFAGMILAESELSHRAAEETLPLRDAFAVLFFLSVGMLFDPAILWTRPLPVLGVLLIIVIGKSIAALVIVMAFGYPLATAATISASLAQIGEFSFILAELGVGLEILPKEGRDLILAGAILSILLNPLIFSGIRWLRPRLERARRATAVATTVVVQPPSEADPEPESDLQASKLTDHTVLVGFGRVGSVVGEALKRNNRPLVVIEEAEQALVALRASGIAAIVGNAAHRDVIAASNIGRASHLIVAMPNAFEAGQVVEQARAINPRLRILARAHSDEEVGYLSALGANEVIMGEREIALAMIQRLGQ